MMNRVSLSCAAAALSLRRTRNDMAAGLRHFERSQKHRTMAFKAGADLV
jgi:hypothetical protein